MTEESVMIGGLKYISSTRAAQLIGYTKDYVGQLCRAGKIDSQLIGRSWYVSEESIRTHKLSVHYNLKNPKKPRTKTSARDDEKTNKNKDISDKTDTDIVKTPLHYAEVPEPIEEEVEEEYDLMPSINKKSGRDVLMRTDFQYEKEETHSYIESSKNSSEHDNGSLGFKSVPIRKPIPNAIRRISPAQHPTGAVVSMDGVRQSRVQKVSQKNSPRISSDRLLTPEEHFPPVDACEEEIDCHHGSNIKHRKKRGSKAIPVIGALIIFLLALIVYLSL